MSFKVGDSVRIVRYGTWRYSDYPIGCTGEVVLLRPNTNMYEVEISPEERDYERDANDPSWPCTTDELELL